MYGKAEAVACWWSANEMILNHLGLHWLLERLGYFVLLHFEYYIRLPPGLCMLDGPQ